MDNKNEFYSISKFQFGITAGFCIFWAFLVNLVLFSEQGKIAIGEKVYLIRFGVIFLTIFIFILLFSTYLKYVVLDDRLEIYNIFSIKLPFIIVAGPRSSKYFAFPFRVAPSSIKFSNVISIKIDSFRVSTPAINIKLINGDQFRLLFFNENNLRLKNESNFLRFYKILNGKKN